ncbi:DUF4258 domain-containing protein [archaeon]|nr:MAG: DUF4258 domain-containing protein [archaeon]
MGEGNSPARANNNLATWAVARSPRIKEPFFACIVAEVSLLLTFEHLFVIKHHLSMSTSKVSKKETKLEKNLRLAREAKAQEALDGQKSKFQTIPIPITKTAHELIEEAAEEERLKNEKLRRMEDGEIVESLIIEGLREELAQAEVQQRQRDFERNATDIVFSTHALERMAQRGITQAQVLRNSSKITIVRKIVEGKMVIVTAYPKGEKEEADEV